MKIHTIADARRSEEIKQRLGNSHQYTSADSYCDEPVDADVILDVIATGFQKTMQPLKGLFVDVTFVPVKKYIQQFGIPSAVGVFGFCGLPSFINRPLLEVSLPLATNESKLKSLCAELNLSYGISSDSAGLVSPRVICMIINEAFYTLEEGTATRRDIDLAMKLGTNYPFGPFEWCDIIGAANVVKVLDTVREATGNDRYVVCNLLRDTGQKT
ncbi:MAG: 3-hydroxyacyl-CoA dehydrogenase [Bacteroidetes bacterium]|nr:3-hydroxyacyl-CoA dehydrogenase [Bacteroidota bacterium]